MFRFPISPRTLLLAAVSVSLAQAIRCLNKPEPTPNCRGPGFKPNKYVTCGPCAAARIAKPELVRKKSSTYIQKERPVKKGLQPPKLSSPPANQASAASNDGDAIQQLVHAKELHVALDQVLNPFLTDVTARVSLKNKSLRLDAVAELLKSGEGALRKGDRFSTPCGNDGEIAHITEGRIMVFYNKCSECVTRKDVSRTSFGKCKNPAVHVKYLRGEVTDASSHLINWFERTTYEILYDRKRRLSPSFPLIDLVSRKDEYQLRVDDRVWEDGWKDAGTITEITRDRVMVKTAKGIIDASSHLICKIQTVQKEPKTQRRRVMERLLHYENFYSSGAEGHPRYFN